MDASNKKRNSSDMGHDKAGRKRMWLQIDRNREYFAPDLPKKRKFWELMGFHIFKDIKVNDADYVAAGLAV